MLSSIRLRASRARRRRGTRSSDSSARRNRPRPKATPTAVDWRPLRWMDGERRRLHREDGPGPNRMAKDGRTSWTEKVRQPSERFTSIRFSSIQPISTLFLFCDQDTGDMEFWPEEVYMQPVLNDDEAQTLMNVAVTIPVLANDPFIPPSKPKNSIVHRRPFPSDLMTLSSCSQSPEERSPSR